MNRRELLAGVPARESLKSAITALVRAVPAAGIPVRPPERSGQRHPEPRSGRLRRPRNTERGFCRPPAAGIRVM